MAPINIAPNVLDCHREGSLHYPDYYRPCEKYNVEKRSQNYLTDNQTLFLNICFHLRKLIAKNKAEGRVYIAKERQDCRY